jgi:hypothetical protein
MTVTKHPPRVSAGVTRIALIASSLIFAASFHYAHFAYLYPVWEYYGFSLALPGIAEYALMTILVASAGAVLPPRIERPSSIVVMALYCTVYVPTVTLTLALIPEASGRYGLLLAALAAGFVMIALFPRWFADRRGPDEAPPGMGFSLCMLAWWAVAMALLVLVFGSIMTFATGDAIYEQRAIGTETSLPMAYLQTYFANVISPGVLALGLVRRNYFMIGAGLLGALVMYLITAQRLTLLVPVLVIGLDWILIRQRRIWRSTALATLVLSGVVAVAAALHDRTGFAGEVGLIVVFRSLALPALTFTQYYDLFLGDGFTWWSHVRGISAVVPPPQSFAQDPLWPMLGRLVGARVYGTSELNANANFFAGDGAAAAGALGVLCISAVFAIYLALLDLAARGWHRRFVLLVMLPVALTYTNGHFFTVMLSFGGLFWLAVFLFYKPARWRRSATAPVV